MDILLKALNHSFTRRMSDGKEFQVVDMIFDFAMSAGKNKDIYDKIQHSKWYIVELDEGQLPK